MLEWFDCVITDREGDVVARVRREVYVREKRRVTNARDDDSATGDTKRLPNGPSLGA